MTWTKLSDDYSDDCWTLSDAAFRLHTEMLIWSNRKLLDCRIPKDDLPRFAKHPDAISELLDVGWASNEPGVYVVRHHAGYQRTRDQVLAQQDANRRNGRKGGRPREQALISETQSVNDSLSDSVGESKTERDRTGLVCKEQPPTNVYGIGSCVVCNSYEKLGEDGTCSRCAVGAMASGAT